MGLLEKKNADELADDIVAAIAAVQCLDDEWKEKATLYARHGHLNQEHMFEIITKLEWHYIAARSAWYAATRRVFDFFFSTLLLLLLSPLMVTLALLIRVGSPGPPIYRQLRIGRYMQPFWVYKFRTMREIQEPNEYQSANHPLARPLKDSRTTKIGAFMRRWSLDELPQLINVLIGDMSLVGPRPLSVDDSAATPRDMMLRYAVKPGLSGLWQVTARHTNDGKLKLRLDCEYVKIRSWRTDVALMLRTIGAIIQPPK